ncbi:metal-sensitive transcriptional regulator [Lacticaseibacillus sharpeae]|uniref:Metal-sensitive transcriptional regulator n=1 Tax=Lacticaseibacillus sharpeae JCM 1186 = DSM 20505 TaxID=1291052 RepID=A0A0R1ZJB6_9LACO|nr:metal-sensitive transcriptional regulator [Lacticaseibacillus sharpeae]KRM54474.1 hypothetical protein FC18_GL000278 [Lacticaseibacillus sharpeae JCM 1186 = DSM 20505]
MTLQYDKSMANRLKRADGQLQGVLRMMADGAECRDVVTQLTAARSSLDKLIGVIVAENLKDCLLTEDEAQREEKIDQAIKLIVRK